MVGSGKRGGRAWRALCALAVAALCVRAAPAAAVVTFDLLHDSPRTRDLLREELSTSALAAAAPAAAPGREDLEAIWFARERYVQIGELEQAQQQLQLLWERAAVRGIRNLPEYGAVLVREARRRMAAGDLEQAGRALGNARRIAPDEPAVYLAGVRLALRRSLLNPVPVWEQLAEAGRAARRSFRAQLGLAGTALALGTASLALFFAVAVGVLFAAAAPRIAHDIREALPVGSARTRAVLAWALLAAPALLGLSPAWWPIVAGLLLWPYADARGRGLVAAGALLVLALPALLRAEAGLLAAPGRPVLGAAIAVREGHWTEADYEELARQAEAGTAGLPGVASLAIAARHLGRLAEAEAACEAGLQAAPEDPVLLTALGNVAFARQDVPGAIERYTRAAAAAPGLFAPHFNLALAHRESFKFAEGEAASRRAAEIDPEEVAYYAGLDPTRVKGFTVDALPPTAALWALARLPGEDREAAAEGEWARLMLGPSLGSWPAVALALVLLSGGLGALRLRRGTATQCERCGRVFCARCQAGRRGALCSQCHHIFVKKEGVDARARVQKMADIKAHRRRLRVRHLALGALAPGAGQLSAGRFWTGLLLLAPAAPLATRLLLGGGRFPAPLLLGGPSAAGAAAGWVLLAGLWAAGLALAWRYEE